MPICRSQLLLYVETANNYKLYNKLAAESLLQRINDFVANHRS
jgi:hypothetical protein